MPRDGWETIMNRLETDVEEQPFPTEEYRDRLDVVQAELVARDLDGLIVTTPENIHYLTGYDTTGYHWFQLLVVPAEGDPGFVVSEFEVPNIDLRTWIDEYRSFSIRTRGEYATRGGAEATAAMLEDLEIAGGRIGFEADSLTLTYERLSSIRDAGDGEFVGCTGIVETPRAIKSSREIEYMKQAGDVLGPALQAGIETIEEGVSEDRVAAEVFYELVSNGSGHVGTQQYVSSGTRSALPHSRWKHRTIEEGDVVYFETTAAFDRYHACNMRTAFLGDPPAVVEDAANTVISALEAALDTMEPGVEASAIDSACREIIEEGGYGSNFVHMTGYSVGIGYPPGWSNGHIITLGPDDHTELQPNMTFHLPIIVFLPEHGAIGFSETVRITDDGVEELVDVPRKLFRV